jgi:hypothetical protein
MMYAGENKLVERVAIYPKKVVIKEKNQQKAVFFIRKMRF